MAAPILIILALASVVPTISAASMCHGALSGVAAEDRVSAHRSCIADEGAAARQLKLEWAKIPIVIRTNCSDEAMIISPSYVEMLTCVEMLNGGKFSGAEATEPLTVLGPNSHSNPR
jgi:hypothetical protein